MSSSSSGRCCQLYLPLQVRLFMLLQHHQQSSHSGSVWGANAASSLPAVIAWWSGITGHQRCFNIASHHCTGTLYGAPTQLQHCLQSLHCGSVWGSHRTVERYYGAPTLLRHCQQSLHGGAVRGTNAALTLLSVIAR